VKNCDEYAFAKFCKRWIRDNLRAPLGKDFDQFLANESFRTSGKNESHLDRLSRVRAGEICKYCDNLGLVEAEELATKKVYAFKCGECDNGARKAAYCATWTLDLNDRYQVMPGIQYLLDEEEFIKNKQERKDILKQ